jgi:hypothetical protein
VKVPADITEGLQALGFELIEEDDDYQWWSRQVTRRRFIDLRITEEAA